ncbi:hypothetical protein [Streptomyces sp. NPDC093225]|uniref:hypothetical protein n=1 Tax=Streptomyces sp. NPDC093225 TaxID=3366034 RepID=UPI0037F9F720
MDTVTAPGGARVRRPRRRSGRAHPAHPTAPHPPPLPTDRPAARPRRTPPHAPGRAPARRPARALAAAAVTALLAATGVACGAPPAPSARPASTTPASPRPATPQELCTRLVAEWTHRVLDGGPHSHLDYQEMGLSGGQYEILRAAVAAGRAAGAKEGPAAAHDAAGAEVERGCAERYRHGTPTGGPWQ